MERDVAAQDLPIGLERTGDAEAGPMTDFESLLRRHERQVLGTALRLLGNMADAQDAAQEVFLRLHKYRRSLDPLRDPAPWLYKTTVNVCFDLRGKRRELPLADSYDAPSPDEEVDAGLDRETRRGIVENALKRLPEKMRAAVVLRDIEGRSTKEVAEILRSSQVTVRSQISQARLRLREMLRRHA